MFDRAWFDNEIAGLEEQLADAVATAHRIEGALQALRAMRGLLGAEQPAAPNGGAHDIKREVLNTMKEVLEPDALTLDDLQAVLPDGHKVDTERGIAPHEN